jgi:E3 ubiquitin-protein ligase MARCH6
VSPTITVFATSKLTIAPLDFIRDPDDPTFHPVRDVLERNIMTQLRKIAFSALVYGSLVTVCLGGVVWGLALTFDGIFPIHWSSNVPVLEFPVDLLFYNFVMPSAIRSIKPSDDLHSVYKWWFRKCARMLRLTDFLFGERRRDEEGHHVRRSWYSFFLGKQGDPENPVIKPDPRVMADAEVYFLRDGKFVRTPASDQVRIPRGGQVFLEVTESNERIDGVSDTGDGLHGKTSDMFTKVYMPPLFKIRIVLFIFMIWMFAAITGVGVTIVPLAIGRRMIASFFPSPIHVNDIYAFSAGLYTVGSLIYALFYFRTGLSVLAARFRPYIGSPRQAVLGAGQIALRALRLIYIFVAFAIFLPSLFALLTELYVLVPLHTYLESQQAHVIHFIQDWTLGVLYVQMAVKLILWQSTSRPALALKATVRDGWLQPNVGLATRAILLPASVLALFAVVTPLCPGLILNITIFSTGPAVTRSTVYRYSYPATFMMGLLVWIGYLLRRQIDVWRANIRDDVYLIGERLHNFGEKRARDVGIPRHLIAS